jgi:hypothetical protein
VSRGPGRWQRALLAAVAEFKMVLTVELAWDHLQREPTRSELVAVRRAAKSIVMSGSATAFYARQCRGCHQVYGNWPMCCPSVGSGAVLVLTKDPVLIAKIPPSRIPTWLSVAPESIDTGATLSAGTSLGAAKGGAA